LPELVSITKTLNVGTLTASVSDPGKGRIFPPTSDAMAFEIVIVISLPSGSVYFIYELTLLLIGIKDNISPQKTAYSVISILEHGFF